MSSRGLGDLRIFTAGLVTGGLFFLISFSFERTCVYLKEAALLAEHSVISTRACGSFLRFPSFGT